MLLVRRSAALSIIKQSIVLRRPRWLERMRWHASSARSQPLDPYAEAKTPYVYGQLHAAMGEPDLARERFAAALAILNRLGERLYAEHIERAIEVLT
jgi:hypothetical protein